MGALKIERYLKTELERQADEVARVRILKGSDQGSIFVVKSSSFVIGRGEEADVRVADLKVSRSHAKLEYTNAGWVVSDLGSSNGILFQGEYIRKFNLRSGEHFTIGDTIFEFLVSTESTRMLTAPLRSGNEVAQLDQALSAQKVRVQNYSKPQKAVPAQGPAAKKFNPRTLVLIAILGGGYYYMEQDQKPAPPPKPAVKKAESSEEKELASYLPSGVSKEVGKTAEQYYRQGFREYREGNYLRARDQFELAVQVNPNHQLARHYLMVSEQDIKNEIKKMIDSAQISKSAGRLREAKGYYEAAMRLMYNDQSNPDYVECEDAVKKINLELERTRQ